MLWFILGGSMVVVSVVVLIRERVFGKPPTTYLGSLFGLPTLVSGVLMALPTWIWYDFAVGFAAMALYEAWQFMAAKRKQAELELAQAESALQATLDAEAV